MRALLLVSASYWRKGGLICRTMTTNHLWRVNDGARLFGIAVVRVGPQSPSMPERSGRQSVPLRDVDMRMRPATEHVEQSVPAGRGRLVSGLMFGVACHTGA
jgi:hypothetical protein